MAEKPKVEFKVTYEQHPDYEGEYQVPILPGLQGTFRLEADAKKAAQKCKDWFNQEKSVVTSVGANGKTEENEHIEYHDNVLVKIETWVDGEKREEEEWDGDEKKKPKKEPALA